MTSRDPVCCCCCQLRLGTTVIGVLFLTSHCLAAILSVVSLVVVTQMPDSEPSREAYLGSSAGSLTFVIIWVILDILLLRGIATRRRVFVLVWLCWSGFFVTLSLLGGIAFVIISALIGEGLLIGMSSSLLLPLLVDVYWTFVVGTYYKRMKLKTDAVNQGGLVAGPVQAGPTAGVIQTSAMVGSSQPYVMGMQQQQRLGDSGRGYDNQAMDMQYRASEVPRGGAGGHGGGGYQEQPWKVQHQLSVLPRVGYQARREYSRGGDRDRREYSRGGDRDRREYSRGGDRDRREYSRGGDRDRREYSREGYSSGGRY